jgi:glyoxylase-like metal-dependent hydrolase (beta-lactamase superfamily II)
LTIIRGMPRPHAFTLLFLATTLGAQPRTADPLKRGLQLSDFPRVVELSKGVYGYEEIRPPGFTTVSLFVVGTNGVLLADGQGSPAATQRLLDEIRRITPLPVRWYVVGSDHGDHTAGNSVLPRDVTWIVHPNSRAQLVRDSTSASQANARAAADAAAKGTTPSAPRVVIVPPRAMERERETVDLGGISVDVLFLGRAHTGGDLMVHVPRDRILFMSEAYLNRVFPAMRSAYPSEWLAMIDRALGMDIARYVPGHGFIEEGPASREELVTFQRALRDVIAEVRRLHAAGRTVDAAIGEARWGDYATWFLADQQAPIAVRKVYEELEGKLR